MAKDIGPAVDKIVSILTESFEGYNDNDIPVSKNVAKFWSKLKRRFPDNVASEFEANPAKNATNLNKSLKNLADNPRIQMDLAMFLYDMGIEIE